jgi:uncharacterized RDD family membrane protein YckC
VVSPNPPILPVAGPQADTPVFPFDRERLSGVVWRRILAYVTDVVIIGLLIGLAWLVVSPLIIVSFGLLLGPLAFALGLVPAAYHTLLIGGIRSATFGHRLFGLEVRALDGGRPSYLQALIHTVLFYVSVALTAFLILAVIPFTRYRQGVHDMLANVVLLRRVRGAEVLPPETRP